MGADLAQLNLVVKSDQVRTAERDLKGLEHQAKRTEHAGNQLGRSYGGLRQSVASLLPLLSQLAAAYALVRAVKTTLVAAGEFEQIEMGMTTLLGSGEKAKKLLMDLEGFAQVTPFEFAGLAQSAKFMLALRFEADKLLPTMKAIGDAAGLLAPAGQGQMTFDKITLALGQMAGRGRVATQEMNQLTETGINGWKYLAEAIGVTEVEIREFVEKGMLDSKNAVTVILAGMTRDFGGGMERASKGILGLWSNVMDGIMKTARFTGDALIEAFDIKNRLQGFLEVLPKMGELVVDVVRTLGGLSVIHKENEAAAQMWATALKVAGVALLAIIAIKPIVFFADLAIAIAGATAAMVGFVAGNPYVLAALLAIGAAVLALEIGRYFIDEFKAARIAFENFKSGFLMSWAVIRETVLVVIEDIKKALDALFSNPAMQKAMGSMATAVTGPLIAMQRALNSAKGTAGSIVAAPTLVGSAPLLGALAEGERRAAKELEKIRREHNDTLVAIDKEFGDKTRKGRTFGQFVADDLKGMVANVQSLVLPDWTAMMGGIAQATEEPKKAIKELQMASLTQFLGTNGKMALASFGKDPNGTRGQLEEVWAKANLVQKPAQLVEAEKDIAKLNQTLTEELLLLGKVGAARERAQSGARLASIIEGLNPDELATINILLDDTNKKIAALEKGKRIEAMAEGIGNAFSDNLTDAVFAAKSLEDALESLYKSIAKLVFQQLVAQPIAGAITSGITGLFTKSPTAAPVTASARGNVFAGGSLMRFADGGVVDSPTTFPMRGGVGLYGEAGPEGILPLKRINGKLGVSSDGGRGATHVTQNFNISTPNADTFRRHKGQFLSDMRAQLGR